jgi:hypothetical protein
MPVTSTFTLLTTTTKASNVSFPCLVAACHRIIQFMLLTLWQLLEFQALSVPAGERGANGQVPAFAAADADS